MRKMEKEEKSAKIRNYMIAGLFGVIVQVYAWQNNEFD